MFASFAGTMPVLVILASSCVAPALMRFSFCYIASSPRPKSYTRRRPETAKQTVPVMEGVAPSFMHSLPTFKTPHQKSSHLPPIEVRKSIVMDICGDVLDAGMDSTVHKSDSVNRWCKATL
ncbi:hypothetical protein EDD22DRAFT_916150, partial [Suillus occidentalis]